MITPHPIPHNARWLQRERPNHADDIEVVQETVQQEEQELRVFVDVRPKSQYALLDVGFVLVSADHVPAYQQVECILSSATTNRISSFS